MELVFFMRLMYGRIGSLYITRIGHLESSFNIVTFWLKFVYSIGKGKDDLVAYHQDDGNHRI